MVSVKLENVTKRFGEVVAVDHVSLKIDDNEFFTLLGPSGCGKTTALRVVAGFCKPDEGYVYFNDEIVNDVPPHKRGTGMVFQNYALWPHMNVFDNVAYGLKIRKLDKGDIKKRVSEALRYVGLEGLERRLPSELSGGQQQRVALARALVIEPQVLLLDEPLSNLDAKLRVKTRVEITRLQKRLGITTVYVTHDQEEALCISDRIAVMHKGAIQQVGSPREIYEKPANAFVADFIGIANFIEGKVSKMDSESGLAFIKVSDGSEFLAISDIRIPQGSNVYLSFRPEAAEIYEPASSPPKQNLISGKIKLVSYLGDSVRYDVETAYGVLYVDVHNPIDKKIFSEGEKVILAFPAESARVIRD
jgi:iron(III) transport system ATP-binding protein